MKYDENINKNPNILNSNLSDIVKPDEIILNSVSNFNNSNVNQSITFQKIPLKDFKKEKYQNNNFYFNQENNVFDKLEILKQRTMNILSYYSKNSQDFKIISQRDSIPVYN